MDRQGARFPFNCEGMNTFTGTNGGHSKQRDFAGRRPLQFATLSPCRSVMATIEELADRVERLLLRHEELQRTNELLATQLGAVTHERDNLRSRLNAARSRIDVLLQRLPQESAPAATSADGNGSGESLRSLG
jgi:cell division protein ZapB